MTERNQLLPDIYNEVPAWSDLAATLDEILKPNVDDPSLLFLDLRNITQNSDRFVLRSTASMLGFSKKAWYINEERLARLVAHLPVFRNQNTTDSYIKFLGFITQYPMGIDYLWTDDYVCFFSVPQGPVLLDDLGNRLDEETNGPGWYNTTHVLIRANPHTIFPDATNPYEALKDLFYSIAPAYLNLEFIGNIANLIETEVSLNIGVVEGHTVDEIKYTYERLDWTLHERYKTPWVIGKELPLALHGHSQSMIEPNTVLITGGSTGHRRGEKRSILMKLEQTDWNFKTVPFSEQSTITAIDYCDTTAITVIGSDRGELSMSKDGGETWTKVWSPFFDSSRPIVDVLWSKTHNQWLCMSIDGFYSVTDDPETWNDGNGPGHILGLDYNSIEFADEKYEPTIIINKVLSGNGQYLVLGNAGRTFSSLSAGSGSVWTENVVKEGYDILAGSYDIDRGQFLVAGTCGWAWITTDGKYYEPVDVGVGDNDITYVQYVPSTVHETGMYVVLGRNNTFSISKDSRLWELLDPKFRADDILCGGFMPWAKIYFASGSRYYSSSKDSSTWSHYSPVFKNGVGKSFTAKCWTYLSSTRRVIVAGSEAGLSLSVAQEVFYETDELPNFVLDHAQITQLNGCPLVAGGRSWATPFNLVSEYQISGAGANTWVPMSTVPSSVYGAAFGQIPDSDSASIWTPRSSKFGVATVLDVAHIPGVDEFWAVGQFGRLSKSKYGIDWILSSSPFPTNNIVASTYNKNRSVITVVSNAVPSNQIKLIESVDQGVTWQSYSLPLGTATRISDFEYVERAKPDIMLLSQHRPIAFKQGPDLTYNVAIADGKLELPNVPTVARSNDGRNWKPEDITALVGVPTRNSYYGIYSEVLARHMICVDGGVATSPDNGVTWKFGGWTNPALRSIDPFDLACPWLTIAEGQGILMAIRVDGKVLLSTDGGSTWAAGSGSNGEIATTNVATIFDLTAWETASRYQEFQAALVYWPGTPTAYWVSIGTDGLVRRSSNLGATWTAAGTQPNWGARTEPSPFRMVQHNNILFAVGNTDSVYTSTDGGNIWVRTIITVGTVTAEKLSSITIIPGSTPKLLIGGHNRLFLCDAVSTLTNQELVNFSMSRPSDLSFKFVAGDLNTGQQITPVDNNKRRLFKSASEAQSQVKITNTGTTGYKVRGTINDLPGSTAGIKESRVQYQVTAIDGIGETRPSEVLTIDIPASTEGTGISIEWTRVPDASGYRVYGRAAGASTSMGILVELPGTAESWVDDGTISPDMTITVPLNDTSGLSGLGSDFTVSALTYVNSLALTIASSKDGTIAWTRNLNSWIGVTNPVSSSTGPYTKGGMSNATAIVACESTSLYVAVGNLGGISTSTNGTSWNDSDSLPAYGDLTCIGYSSDTDSIMLGTSANKIVYSTDQKPLIGFGRAVTITTETQPSDRTEVYYRYWITKIKNGTESNRSLAYHWSSTAGASYPVLTWPRGEDSIDGYKIYRQQDSNVNFTSGNPIVTIGTVKYPVNATYKVVTWADRYNLMTSWIPEFIGSGLNDIHVVDSGYTDSSSFIVTVRVVETGAVDKVTFEIGDSEPSSPVNMVDFPSTVSVGTNIGFRFDAVTGHTLGACWKFRVYPASSSSALPTGNNTRQVLGTVWNTQNLPVGSSSNDIAWVSDLTKGVSGWVTVGNSGSICISTDFVNWSTMIQDVVGSTNLRGISYALTSNGASTTVVIVGDGRFLSYSENFFNSPLVLSEVQGFSGDIRTVNFNPETKLFTAAGQDTSIGTSKDGRNWTMTYLSSALTTWIKVSSGSESFSSMLVGEYGAFSTSHDGLVWVTRELGYSTGTAYAIIPGPSNNVVVAGDNSTIVHTSNNGNTWSQAISPVQKDFLAGTYCATSGLWVLVGVEGTIVTSSDGTTWTSRNSGTTQDLVAVAVKPSSNVLLAVNSITGDVVRSIDGGLTWNIVKTSLSGGGTLVSGYTDIVCSTSGIWIATSYDGKISRSQNDGLTWVVLSVDIKPWFSRKYEPSSEELIDFTACTFGDNVFVVGGSQGDILVSTDNQATDFVLKDSRLNGVQLVSLDYGSKTFLSCGDRGAMVTAFSEFSPRLLLTGGVVSNLPVSTVWSFDRTAGATGTWTTESSTMLEPRSGHSATTMIDGTIFVCGGIDATGKPLRTTERYLPHRGLWVADKKMPYPKGWLKSVTLEKGAVLALGAGCDPNRSALVYVPCITTPSPPILSPGPGVLAAGTYHYRISAISRKGETVATNPVSITLTETGGVVIDWEPVDNAMTYRIYGRDEGAAVVLMVVPGHLTSYSDLGVPVFSGVIADIVFKREDTMENEWLELHIPMPLPREYCGVSFIDKEVVSITGGYNDHRTWRITDPTNRMRISVRDGENTVLAYVHEDYWDEGYTTPEP